VGAENHRQTKSMNFIKNFSRRTQQLIQRGQQRWQWHWLDGLVLGAIIIALGGLLWMRLQRQTQWVTTQIEISQEEWWWKAEGPAYWYLNRLEPGTPSFNSFGEQVAVVDKVELVDIGDSRQRALVTVKLKVSYDAQKQQYVFGFQPLQVGRAVELSFGKQQFKGLVTSIDQPALPMVERSVRIKIKKLNPTIAKSYKVGLQSLTNTGEPVATITQLQVTQAMEDNFSDIRGQIVVVPNSGYIDVIAVVKLRLTQDGDQYYFADGKPVKVSGLITIQFPQALMKEAQILEWVDAPVQ
jgi:hypothetical protein